MIVMGARLNRIGLVLILTMALSITLLWFSAFTVRAPIYTRVAMEGVMLAIMIGIYLLISKLKISKLGIGWGMLTLGFFADFLGEFTESEAINVYLAGSIKILGLSIIAMALYMSQNALSEELQKTRVAGDQLRLHTEELEKMVEEKTKSLQDAQRLATIGEATNMVAHDLRNPLQVIMNTVYLTEEVLNSLTDAERESLRENGIEGSIGRIKRQSEYMDKVISDLQDYTRPVKLEIAEVMIPQLIRDVLSSMRTPDGIEIEVVEESGLEKVCVDIALMRRVFTNLIVNAYQAMPNGGKLTISVSQKDGNSLVSISDTGVGISDDNIHRLFNPLFTTKSKGMGLGLAVCRKLTEAHGGKISVVSQLGKGSTFTVKVPIRGKCN